MFGLLYNMPKFLSGFMMTMVGARRSGKSTLIKKLLKTPRDNNGLKGMFRDEDIFIICPTLDLNDDFEEFKDARKFSKPDPNLIMSIMKEQEFNIKTYGKKRTPNILIILDDCADNKIIRFGGILDTLAVRGRHFKISVLISSQRLNAVSCTARINSDYFILFSPYNLAEAEKFMEQFVLKKDRKNFADILFKIWSKPFNFVVVDNSERAQDRKIKEGFDKVIGRAKKIKKC